MEEHQFIQTLNQHSQAIDKICRQFCRGREDLFDDLRQEAILRLWMGWKRYRPSGATSLTWVWRVTMNSCISWLRSQSHRPFTLPLDLFDLPDESLQREQAEHLRALIALLPRDEQRLVGLYLDGWTNREIGQMLQLSESNVGTKLSRIREKLRKLNNQ